MGLLDYFKRTGAMKHQKGDKVHPATFGNSHEASSASVGTPSKPPPGKKKEEAGPMGWHKAGGFPNPPLPPPATYGRPRRKSSFSCPLCYYLSFLFSFLVVLIILAGLTVIIIYVVFQPKLPKATIQNVAITKFTVANRAGGPLATLADLQSPVLNANIAFTIQVENPNEKVGIHFRDMSVLVSYNGTEFAHSVLAPFYQGRNTTSEVLVDLKASSAPLSQSQGKELQSAISRNDIPLFARIKVGAALEIGTWVIPPGHIQVACDLRASPPMAPQGAKLLSKSCKWLR